MLNQMLLLSDILVCHPQTGKLKSSCCLKKKMSLFIDRSTLSLSGYMKVTNLPVYRFIHMELTVL